MARNAVIKSFYNSKEWKTFRLMLINDRGNRCDSCHQIIADASKLTGHHTTELTQDNVHDKDISLNPDRIELLCHECHNKEHKRFEYRGPLEKKVFVIYGPPLSGKSTYVIKHKARHDLVIDMDRLYEAVTLLPRYDKPDALLNNVMLIHNELIDSIETRYGKWNNAWIVGGYADKYKREQLANNLDAELVFCDVNRDECIRRLDNDKKRKPFRSEWIGYIDKWFEKYQT